METVLNRVADIITSIGKITPLLVLSIDYQNNGLH